MKPRGRASGLCGSIAAFVVITVVAPPPICGQSPEFRTVSGKVVDSAGVAIPWVNIGTTELRSTVSGDSGTFRLVLRNGSEAKLLIRRIGYAPTSVPIGSRGDTTLTISLTPVAQQLTAENIFAARSRTLELRGFYERMRMAALGPQTGTFITPEYLEQRNAGRVTQVLEGISGLRIVRTSPTCQAAVRCYEPAGANGCRFTIYVDGSRFTKLTGGENFIDEVVTPTTVAGIEVYTRMVNVPPQYSTLSGTCGVLLIWTR